MPAAIRYSAEAVMPLRSAPSTRWDWAALGLPASGWVQVTDLTQCTQCPEEENRPCTTSCASAHDLLPETRQAMDRCYHCDPAPCEKACPADAIYRSPQGVVKVDQELCIGCHFCVDACPNGALQVVDPYQVDVPAHAITGYDAGRPYGSLPLSVFKCTLCEYRVLDGKLPVCSEACPHGAIWVGNLDRNTATNGQQVVRLTELLGKRTYYQTVPGQRIIQLMT